MWSKCQNSGAVAEVGFLIAWVFLFSGSSTRAVLRAQTQAPAYSSLELLTAHVKEAEEEQTIGSADKPFCCLRVILCMLFLWINNLRQWPLSESSSDEGISQRKSPTGNSAKGPHWGTDLPLFSLPSHPFKAATENHHCAQIDASPEQLRRLLQQKPKQQVKNYLLGPEESSEVYHPPLGKNLLLSEVGGQRTMSTSGPARGRPSQYTSCTYFLV